MTKGKGPGFLQANSKIEVKPQGDEKKYYKSHIHGVKENLFLINPPYRGKDDLLLHKGDQVDVVLITDKEKYIFAARVVDRVTTPLQGYVLMVQGEAKRIQMREFVRVKVLLDVEIGEFLEEEGLDEVIYVPATMVDLSGGGAGVVSNVPFGEGKQLILRFNISLRDEERRILVMTEVRRCHKMEDLNRYMVGVAFKGLSDRDQDQIIEYIFQKQREQRLLEDGVE